MIRARDSCPSRPQRVLCGSHCFFTPRLPRPTPPLTPHLTRPSQNLTSVGTCYLRLSSDTDPSTRELVVNASMTPPEDIDGDCSYTDGGGEPTNVTYDFASPSHTADTW